jgi:hypothetical protein
VNRHERVYRRLLRAYPAGFHSDYADEMARLFLDQLQDAEAGHRPFAVAGLWARSIVDLVTTAPAVHIRREDHVPQPVDLAPPGDVSGSAQPVSQGPRVLLGLLPLWILVSFMLITPGFMEPAFANPPAALGLPFGVFIIGIALAVMIIGVQILRRASPTVALVAFICFTVPSVIAIILAPAMILVLVNLSGL